MLSRKSQTSDLRCVSWNKQSLEPENRYLLREESFWTSSFSGPILSVRDVWSVPFLWGQGPLVMQMSPHHPAIWTRKHHGSGTNPMCLKVSKFVDFDMTNMSQSYKCESGNCTIQSIITPHWHKGSLSNTTIWDIRLMIFAGSHLDLEFCCQVTQLLDEKEDPPSRKLLEIAGLG